MKCLLLVVCVLATLLLPANASEKANTVLVHPGDTIYARFEVKGQKLKLVGTSKEKDEGAQVVITLGPDPKKPTQLYSLKLESKFPRDLLYKLQMRSKKRNLEMIIPVSPVVAGKVAFEQFPQLIDELALYDFKLEK